MQAKHFLFKSCEGPWYGANSCTVDEVGRREFSIFKLLISLFLVISVTFQRAYHLHSRFKKKHFATLRKCLTLRIRFHLARQNFLKLCVSRILPLASENKDTLTPRSHSSQEHVSKKHVLSIKGKCRVKTWLNAQRRYIHTRFLVYLFMFLLLCGDVHPNPGPALRPHRRHPQATSLVTAAWNVRTLLEKTNLM